MAIGQQLITWLYGPKADPSAWYGDWLKLEKRGYPLPEVMGGELSDLMSYPGFAPNQDALEELIRHCQAGHIVTLVWHPDNPTGGPFGTPISTVNLQNMIKDATAVGKKWQTQMVNGSISPQCSKGPLQIARLFTTGGMTMFSRPATARMFSVLLVALFALACVFVVPVHAGGVVGNGTPGSCTEGAFDAALVGGGPITCNCGPNPVTITLTGQKSISSATTIDGGGRITLYGNSATRIFEMNTGAGPAHMELKNITLRKGSANNGGAVYVASNQTVWMEDVSIDVSAASMDGGAIYVDSDSTLTLTNVGLYSNTSLEEGGAIYNNRGTLNLANVLFENNVAIGWGGGLNNNRGQATLTDVTFRRNSAGNGNSAGGGGIDNYVATLTVTNSLFEDNYSDNDGGGLRVMGGGTVSLTNVTMSGNRAHTKGGGIMSFAGRPAR